MKKVLFFISVLLLATFFSPSILAQKTYSVTGKSIQAFSTAENTDLRLSSTGSLTFKQKGQPFENEVMVFVDPSKTFQSYLGIGAAITDASAETFYKLTPAKQKEFMDAHFDPQKGIGYSIVRTNINSCDFSSDMYTYVKEGDKELKSFDISHDKKYKIPMIKEAMKTKGSSMTLIRKSMEPAGMDERQ